MKHIEHITEYFSKLNEKLLFPLFKNEKELKDNLIKNKSFANGNISEGISQIVNSKCNSDNNFYNITLDCIKNKYGIIPYFTMMFDNYDGQVCNGGHSQYYDNGYASANSKGFGFSHNNIDVHDDFVNTFGQLNLKNILPYGNKMYNTISNFTLEMDEEIEVCSYCGGSGEVDCYDCDGSGDIECSECGGTGEDGDGETCSACDGSGNVTCDECNGKGHDICSDCNGSGEYNTGNSIPDNSTWDTLDKQWYDINEYLEKQYNDYLKTLTLDGEKIEDLFEFAKSSLIYNL